MQICSLIRSIAGVGIKREKMIKRRLCLCGALALLSATFTVTLYQGLIEILNHRIQWEVKNEDPYAWLYGKEFEDALDRANETKKVIIIWHPDGDISRTKELNLPWKCGSCKVTGNKDMITHNETAGVIFLYSYITQPNLMPKSRNPNQFWVWMIREAAPYVLKIRSQWIDKADSVGFNLTMTHRRDADIFYGYENEQNYTANITTSNALARKKHLALAAVSNCRNTNGASVRMQYLKGLIQLGFNLTTMGRCFGDESLPKTEKDKMMEVIGEYKFFIGFENAYHCKDYITEKFFRPLKAGTVPVVWGGRKEYYETIGAPGSFIFVEDFPSMQELIDYLNYLNKNDTAYLEYFRWRDTENDGVDSRRRRETDFCQLCRVVNGINVDDAYKENFNVTSFKGNLINETIQEKKVNAHEYFVGSEDKDCLENKDLFLDEMGRISLKQKNGMATYSVSISPSAPKP